MPEATTRAPDPGLTAFVKGLMMKRRILILLILCLFGLAGCTYNLGGPYVTDIAFDDEGNLLVTKNTLIYKEFSGYQNGENPQTTVIKAPKK